MRITKIAVFLPLLLFTAGCASYHVRPSADSVALPKCATPIPVAVGLTQTEQKLEGGFPDLIMGFKRALDESGTFQTVYYPAGAGNEVDGDLKLKINARMKTDPALAPKAFLTGFLMFLPAPFVYYKHKYEAVCNMDVVHGDKIIKTYTAKVSAIASHQLFGANSQMETEATLSAAKLLYTELLRQLQSDERLLATELKRAKS